MLAINRCSVAPAPPAERLDSNGIHGIQWAGVVRNTPNRKRLKALPFTSTPTEPLIDRGFTFHEHLYPFTLINMNGRAYDPLVGRFLSTDPYIQAPDNTQNLNRYSYCLNNPLRYSDPSGNEWWNLWFVELMDWINDNTEDIRKQMVDAGIPDLNVGGSFSTDGKNWQLHGGVDRGINISYDSDKGWGVGYSDGFRGDNRFYYPTYNYGAVEQNAMRDYNAGRVEAMKDNLVNSQTNTKYPGIRIYESSWIRGGISLPPFAIIVERFPNNTSLKEHECGHYLQYQEMGAFDYYTRVALPSIYNKVENDIERVLYDRVVFSVDHSYYPVETDANRRAKEYFGPSSPINTGKYWPGNSKSTPHPWYQRLFLDMYFYH